MIGHEEGVELAPLQRLREAREVFEIEIRIWKGAWISPGRSVDANRPHESAQAHLTRAAHCSPPIVAVGAVSAPRIDYRFQPFRRSRSKRCCPEGVGSCDRTH